MSKNFKLGIIYVVAIAVVLAFTFAMLRVAYPERPIEIALAATFILFARRVHVVLRAHGERQVALS